MANTTRHRTLRYNNYDIHYFVSGSSHQESVLCLHPAFGDHNCFNLQINDLTKLYKVITIDMLGHGLSQPKKTKDKIDLTPKHIKLILEIEGIHKVHILGVSLGSLMGQYFAEIHPEHVNSLCILGGYNINIVDKEINKAQRKESLKWISRLVFSMESFRRHVAKQSVFLPESQEGYHEMALKFSRKSLMYMSGIRHIIKNRPPSNQNIPFLIMVGDLDVELAKKKSKEFHNYYTNSTFLIIGNAGHCANMDNPYIFNLKLISWLGTLNEA